MHDVFIFYNRHLSLVSPASNSILLFAACMNKMATGRVTPGLITIATGICEYLSKHKLPFPETEVIPGISNSQSASI